MSPNVCKHHLIIYGCLKFTFKKGGRIKKNEKKCENSKSLYPRFLGDFYFYGTMNVSCTRQQESIRNWGTFCVPTPTKSRNPTCLGLCPVL